LNNAEQRRDRLGGMKSAAKGKETVERCCHEIREEMGYKEF
jgi:hypothetical protein